MNKPTTRLRALLFDLDGTLMETAPDLVEALARTLKRLGRPPIEAELVRSWIGDGAQALLGRALAHARVPGGATAAHWQTFAYEYEECCGTRSHLHRGVLPMLQRLQAEGLRLAVLTNKESRFAHRLLARFELTEYFDLLVAGDSLPVKKPDPRVVRHALDALQAAPEEAALIGDSVVDVRTARAAGVPAWLVRHGYPNGPLEGADAPDAFIEDFARFDPHGPGFAASGRRLVIA